MKAFDIVKSAIELLPIGLRTPKLTSIMRAACGQLLRMHDTVHNTHYHATQGTYYTLAHNGQVCLLEAALNDNFDAKLRRIGIDLVQREKRLYIYTDNELRLSPDLATHLHDQSNPTYMWEDTKYVEDDGQDFTVFVPKDLNYIEAEMRRLIEYYKIAGVTYAITQY